MKILSTQSFELIRILTINYLKIKYKRTSLGLLWSLLNPLLSVGMISFVFSTLMRMNYADFVIMFFPAFISWTFFSNAIMQSSTSLINNEALIKKSPINIMIFPLVNVSINLVEFALTTVAFAVVLIVTRYHPTIHIFVVFYSIITLVISVVGLSLMISVISTFLRDVSYLISVLLQLWFYLSPILYKKDFVMGKYWMLDVFMKINPLVYFIDMFRMPITYHEFPPLSTFIIVTVLAILSLSYGCYVFNKNRYKLIYRL